MKSSPPSRLGKSGGKSGEFPGKFSWSSVGIPMPFRITIPTTWFQANSWKLRLGSFGAIWGQRFLHKVTRKTRLLGISIAIFEGIWGSCKLGVFQQSLTLILLQEYHDTNGRRIVLQSGGVYTTFCQEEGILLQMYRNRNGRCIVVLFKSIGVMGRFDSPEVRKCQHEDNDSWV